MVACPAFLFRGCAISTGPRLLDHRGKSKKGKYINRLLTSRRISRQCTSNEAWRCGDDSRHIGDLLSNETCDSFLPQAMGDNLMDDYRVMEIAYKPDRLCIHPSARAAYRAWLDAGPVSQRYRTECLLSKKYGADVLRYSPIPVIKRSNPGKPNVYQAVGRFGVYYQVRLLRPETVSIAVLNGSGRKDKDWPRRRVEALSQGMHVLDIGARCGPPRELWAVQKAAKRGGWPALAEPRPTRQWIAETLGIPKQRLRWRVSNKEEVVFLKRALKILDLRKPEQD